MKDEFAVVEKIVLRGHQIVIHESLRYKAVELAHAGHQGMVKTKALVREKVWFPGIDKMVEQQVKYCLPCQAAVATNAEPLQMSVIPPSPWTEVAIDFKGPLPNGQYLLVVYDMYSRFPEVEMRQVLERLKQSGATLNAQKCNFGKTEVKFYERIFNGEGIAGDPRKIGYLREAPQPSSSSEAKSLLGLAQYLSRFILD
ncbi:uncharacterized protein K02A2.6-like [Anneissia japonica]|uniref:uncharacterized protein K02A2.6-like n=1 Tax=Anneissia japonica TaxID=1529436 RepID=UPI00142552E0|nr:uncharacterized protein K02A2.6-like [Anneissia japonica]